MNKKKCVNTLECVGFLCSGGGKLLGGGGIKCVNRKKCGELRKNS
ncbi:MAG TPA: hypothetical protein P5543_09895 [Planctomycetota bacterium]|nr:hypothetical protein [Planctomycetota bacterium]